MTGIIDIILLDEKGRDACEAACGLDWSESDNIVRAKERVKARFSREADISYYDVSGGMPAQLDINDRALPALIIKLILSTNICVLYHF